MTESRSTPDRTAWFEAETERLLPDLYGAALRLAKNGPDAEDLVADSIGKAWTRLHQLENPAAFRGWVFRILHNCFVSAYRTQRGRGAAGPEPGEDEPGFSLFEHLQQPFLLWWGSSPEQEFLDRLLREDLERALDGLPEVFRVVVVLADLQGFAYREIAGILGIPVGTVRSRLARGRGLLQRALWEHAVDAGLRGGPQPEPQGENS